ncbi:serine hydrolase domain-containing protein [Brachybacterium huguangmaarense]
MTPPALGAALEVFGFPATAGLTDASGTLVLTGAPDAVRPLASVSKPIAALGVLVAVARGMVDLDEPAGPEGSTVRHLLAHAAGYGFDSPPEQLLTTPGTRRIYSSTGFDVLAEHLEEATGYPMAEWMETAVVGPLGLTDLDVEGSPAAGYAGTVADLLVIGREMLAPTLVPRDLWDEATSVQFPGLAGILPGYGRQKPNDWGLGLEIRDGKSPHWTGAQSSPRTFGHFGQSGSFLWVDPDAGLAGAFLGAEPFGPAHVEHWPAVTDAMLALAGRDRS